MKKMLIILGYALAIFALADFGFSYLGYNLTPFFPELISRYSPLIIGAIAYGLISVGSGTFNDESKRYDEERTTKSGAEMAEEEERKKK